MKASETDIPLKDLQTLAFSAGAAILDIYNDTERMSQFTLKQDASPLTLADRASHDIIAEGIFCTL